MNKKFILKVLKISIPITLQSLINASVGLIDIIMIGKLGETEIASIGIANQPVFVYFMLVSAFSNAGAIFTAQYYGKNNPSIIRKISKLSVLLTLLLSIIFAAIGFFFASPIMSIYTNDMSIIKLSVDYLKIISISFIPLGITIAFSNILRSISITKVPFYGSVSAVLANFMLNYALIFGKFGFPTMGVKGAALASLIARVVEMGVILISIYIKNYPVIFTINKKINLSKKILKNYFEVFMPIVGSNALIAFGFAILNILYAKLGKEALTAVNIFNSIQNIATIGIGGLATTTGIICGQIIGRGDIREALENNKKIVKINFFLASFTSILIIIFSNSILNSYNISSRVFYITKLMLIIFSILLPISTINGTNISGLLRAGGDTTFIFIMDMLCMWGVMIPFAYLGYKLSMPLYFIYGLSFISESIVKITVSKLRIKSKKWIKVTLSLHSIK